MIAVLEEERLSFLSSQSEAEEGSLSESSDGDPSQQPPGHLSGSTVLCVGNQTLKIPDKLSGLLQDIDSQGIFSQIYDPNSDNYAKQLSVIEEILKENPDFNLSDLEFDSDLSDLSQPTTLEGILAAQRPLMEPQGRGNAGDRRDLGVQVERSLERIQTEDRNKQEVTMSDAPAAAAGLGTATVYRVACLCCGSLHVSCKLCLFNN
jgi:hypothetical protein